MAAALEWATAKALLPWLARRSGPPPICRSYSAISTPEGSPALMCPGALRPPWITLALSSSDVPPAAPRKAPPADRTPTVGWRDLRSPSVLKATSAT